MNIRKFHSKDFNRVQFICLNSEGPCDHSEEFQEFLLATYCNYYIENEPEHCFVAADENDNAIGYIISAFDFDIFYKKFTESYPLENEEFIYAAKESVVPQNKFKEDYPAHFHIDILPEYQRMGLGHRLVDTLVNELKLNGIKGVMLTVWNDNSMGISFYKKYGFTLIDTTKSNHVFGLTL